MNVSLFNCWLTKVWYTEVIKMAEDHVCLIMDNFYEQSDALPLLLRLEYILRRFMSLRPNNLLINVFNLYQYQRYIQDAGNDYR